MGYIRDLQKLKKSQFMHNKETTSLGPVENVMLKTFNNTSKSNFWFFIITEFYKAPLEIKSISKINNLEKKKNKLSKLDLKGSTSTPFLGLAGKFSL